MGRAVPERCSPSSQRFSTHLDFFHGYSTGVTADPMPITRLRTDTTDTTTGVALILPRMLSSIQKEKFCDTKCQLDCHIGNLFTWVLCFDSFGVENKTKIYGSLTKSMGPRFLWDFAVEGLGWSSWQHLSPTCVVLCFFFFTEKQRVCISGKSFWTHALKVQLNISLIPSKKTPNKTKQM